MSAWTYYDGARFIKTLHTPLINTFRYWLVHLLFDFQALQLKALEIDFNLHQRWLSNEKCESFHLLPILTTKGSEIIRIKRRILPSLSFIGKSERNGREITDESLNDFRFFIFYFHLVAKMYDKNYGEKRNGSRTWTDRNCFFGRD